jgi:gas vesicle protein
MIPGKKISGFLMSFLLGSAVGGAIALLYAPKSGKNFRHDISKKTNDLIDEGKKLTTNSWNGVKDTVESTFDSANDFLNTGVEKIMHKTEKVKDAFRSGIDTYKDERKSGKNSTSLYNDDVEKTKTRIT